MKFLLIAIAFATTTTTAFAKERGLFEFKIQKATFAAAHVKNAGSGKLLLNYEKGEVTLTVTQRFSCPEGLMCAQVMPAPVVVELPIVSVTKDACGIRTVTAKDDGRPADGMLQEIVVKDPTRMTCKTFVAVAPTATYKTAFYNRMSGKEVKDQSDMVLALNTNRLVESDILETSLAPAMLVEFTQNSGFSPEPTTRTLFVDATGRVLNHVQNHRTGLTSQSEVAQLSKGALNGLEQKVNSINANAELNDLNAGQPECTDAPTSSVVAHAQSGAITLSRTANCHSFEIQDVYALQVREIMKGLARLSR